MDSNHSIESICSIPSTKSSTHTPYSRNIRHNVAKRGETMVGLRRGIELLEQLAAVPDGLGFNEIRERFEELSPSTLSRLLKALQEEEMIVLEPRSRRYVIGERSLHLGQTLATRLSTAQRVAGIVAGLARATGCSAAFFELRGELPVLLKKHDMPEAFHYAPEGHTARNYAHHAFAKVCFAYAPANIADIMRERLREAETAPPGRQPMPLDRPWAMLEEELQTIRRTGLCVCEHDDQAGLKRIAVPVLQLYTDAFLGAIGISLFGELDTVREDRLSSAVRAAARDAAQALTRKSSGRRSRQ